MQKILLVCSAGMSTSLLVTKMEKEAEKRGLDTKIWAVSTDAALRNMEEADVVLLGPQIRFMLNDMKSKGEKYGLNVEVIPSVDYGMCNGAKVLDLALKLIKK
ncbi:PTS sugar transporter subunit IIB [Caproiciproducens sp. MSJ-32]|uniref:PTS sugar transporter subunit IIB n=1 Tax=Caproiciproducens sp. MSJ-32 TaxID=2841527 RepID=UPI001C0FA846|nr:PTS sugar transporter subunit IIB [Caproiciproducens sp. MSJ-32]MBU5455849.1 PTS sugar transporter subunit IIB [Caproiciproducens sp. MSJ-32]